MEDVIEKRCCTGQVKKNQLISLSFYDGHRGSDQKLGIKSAI